MIIEKEKKDKIFKKIKYSQPNRLFEKEKKIKFLKKNNHKQSKKIEMIKIIKKIIANRLKKREIIN